MFAQSQRPRDLYGCWKYVPGGVRKYSAIAVFLINSEADWLPACPLLISPFTVNSPPGAEKDWTGVGGTGDRGEVAEGDSERPGLTPRGTFGEVTLADPPWSTSPLARGPVLPAAVVGHDILQGGEKALFSCMKPASSSDGRWALCAMMSRPVVAPARTALRQGHGSAGAQRRSGVKDEMKDCLDSYSWNGALASPTDNLLLFRWKTEQGLTPGQRAGPADSLKMTPILS